MGDYLKLFSTDADRLEYEDGETYIEPYVSYVEGDNTVHYNKPPFFCKLTLSDDSVVELEGSGTLTKQMTLPYSATCVSAEIGTLCTSIGQNAFSQGYQAGYPLLTSVTIPNTVTSIDGSAFQYCTSLTSVDIPDSVTSIAFSAFYMCSGLTSVTIGSGLTSINSYVFGGCSSLTEIIIPNNVTSIGENAFEVCSGLTNVIIGSGVTNIGNQAFTYCTGLTNIIIPDNVTRIGSNAFNQCSSLTSITSLATTAPTIQSSTFQNVKANGTLTVPSGSTGYDVWMGTGNYYLGKYNWTKVEQ